VFVKPTRNVARVFLHCSASDRPEDDNIKTITKWHMQRGFVDVGYHFYIDNMGVVHEGRSLEAIPAAQQGHNIASIAICAGGLTHFSDLQLSSVRELCEQINKAYKGKISFHGHCEVSDKTCPVFDYKTLLNLNSNGKMMTA
jgi:hypothetical protein